MNIKLRTKFIFVFFVISISILIFGYFSTIQLNKAVSPIKNEIPLLIDDISLKSNLDSLAQSIKYYDEVLTQSARNYAFTKDAKWQAIYNENVVYLDETIAKSLKLGDSVDKKYFDEINASNIALVEMETKSFELVNSNHLVEARMLLDSQEYWHQKNIYKSGLNKFIERRNEEKEKSFSYSIESLKSIETRLENSTQKSSNFLLIFTISIFLVILVVGIIFSNNIVNRLNNIKIISEEIGQGNSNARINIEANDEIGDLAKSFNNMADKLMHYQFDLENRIKERTKKLEEEIQESEKTNKLMVGRELQMIEMKKRIAELKTEQ